MDKPKIITICGSTRFADLHYIMKWELEKEGKVICLTINYLPGWYIHGQNWTPDHIGEQYGNKDILDELHLRKIDISDSIFVVNQAGYIGESTRQEIEYAKKLNKEVIYMVPLENETK